MLDGVMLLWFVLTALAVLFVAIDIRATPESNIMKWGFVLVTAYTGPFGAFLYVLGCREPLPGLHERYVAARWRQALGSTMHCVAGDGVGILLGAVIASAVGLSRIADIALEYALGFAFGLLIFQALFMRDIAGGSYARALKTSFLPEFLSMNCLMGGMVPVMTAAMMRAPNGNDPAHPAFWFVMSMALLCGAIVAYPMNWWLVANHLKHGMTTVRSGTPGHADHAAAMPAMEGGAMTEGAMSSMPRPSDARIAAMTAVSIALFALGLAISAASGGMR
jgi:Domain of unknown function (DUF4396)